MLNNGWDLVKGQSVCVCPVRSWAGSSVSKQAQAQVQHRKNICILCVCLP